MIPIRVRLGAYAPERVSASPGLLERFSRPVHLRPDVVVPVPNRADRRKARKR